MNRTDDAGDDNFVARLAEYDEALANQRPAPTTDGELDATLRERLSAAQECLELLESAWPRHRNKPTPASNPPPALSLPVAIGRFQLRRELGRGGFGIVFLAFDPNLNRQVALKIPRPEVLVTADLRRRWTLEAEAAARLSHPNLVSIHEFGDTGPYTYFVTQYIPGPSLAEWLRQQTTPLPPREVARFLLPLVESVAYMHDQGVLHRDIKPSNVLLQSAAESLSAATPKLTDFGLAKLIDEAAAQTRSGAMLGTPIYMAPEQADHRLAEVGPHSDIYALGIVLYELLTRRPPFLGENDADTIRQLLDEEPLPPRRLRPDIPRDLETICLKCLEKQPRCRYADTAALAADLRRFVAGQPIQARPAGPIERLRKWASRHPSLAVMSVVTAASLVSVAAAMASYAIELKQHNQRLTAALDRAEAGERRVRLETYAEQIRLANVLRGNQAPEVLHEFLSDSRSKLGPEDLRSFEWRLLWTQAQLDTRRLPAQHRGWAEVSYCAEAQSFASVGRESQLKIWDVQSGRLQQTHHLALARGRLGNALFSADGSRLLCVATDADSGVPHEFTIWQVATGERLAQHAVRDACNYQLVALSPNGAWVAYLSYPRPSTVGTIRLMNALSGEHCPFESEEFVVAKAIGLSPDGKLLAVAHQVGERADFAPFVVDVIDVWENRRVSRSPALVGLANRLIFSGDSKLLAVTSFDKEGRNHAWLVDVTTGQVHDPLPNLLPAEGGVTVARDGGFFALGSGLQGALVCWDADQQQQIPTTASVGAAINSLSVSPDHQAVVAGCFDGDIRWCRLPRVATPSSLPGGGNKEAWSVAFSPDSRILAVGYDDEAGGDRETLKLWDVATGRELANLSGHQAMVSEVRFLSADVLVSSSYDRRVNLWDVPHRKLLTTFSGDQGRLKCLAVSADHKQIAAGGFEPFINVWDVASGQPKLKLEGPVTLTHRIMFAPDDRSLATTDNDGNVCLWDLPAGQLRWTTRDRTSNAGLAYSPEGKLLATGNRAGVIRLYDLQDPAAKPHELRGHKGEVRYVVFSPDGRTLASAGEDRTVRLWQVATGRELLVFRDLPDQVNGLAFAPNGQHLAAAIHDGSVRLWYAADSR